MNKIDELEYKVNRLSKQVCKIKKTVEDIDDDITVVENYSALPDPTTVSGKFYWVSNPQGVKWTPDWDWLPFGIGAPYYGVGMYFSNGVTWEYTDLPYQATQTEVNTGVNNDKFVTPLTLKNRLDTIIANANYLHDQGVPSDTWIINHNLGKYPSVTIIDSSNREVVGDVRHPSTIQTVLYFNNPFSGRATLN